MCERQRVKKHAKPYGVKDKRAIIVFRYFLYRYVDIMSNIHMYRLCYKTYNIYILIS